MEFKRVHQAPYLRIPTAWMKGKTIEKALMPQEDGMVIHFTDGSRVELKVMGRYCDDAWLEVRTRDG